MTAETNLESLRNDLRKVDDQIIDLIATRLAIIHQIGQVKKETGVAIKDDTQEHKNLTANLLQAGPNIPRPMVEELTKFLASWGRRLQQ